jgi:hypothetical protein
VINRLAIDTLSAEYVRARNRADGAAARITFAESSLAAEQALHLKFEAEMSDLEDAIVLMGGTVPPPEVPL